MMSYACIFLTIIFFMTAHYLFWLDKMRDGMPRRLRLFQVSVRFIVMSWFFHFLALGCWVYALASFDLSYAFPLLSLGYVLIYATELKSNPSYVKIIGMVCILTGLFLII